MILAVIYHAMKLQKQNFCFIVKLSAGLHVDGWMDGWMYGWMDGSMTGIRTHVLWLEVKLVYTTELIPWPVFVIM